MFVRDVLFVCVAGNFPAISYFSVIIYFLGPMMGATKETLELKVFFAESDTFCSYFFDM